MDGHERARRYAAEQRARHEQRREQVRREELSRLLGRVGLFAILAAGIALFVYLVGTIGHPGPP